MSAKTNCGVLKIDDAFAELLSLLNVGESALQRVLGAAESAGGDIETPAIETAHRVFEAFAFGTDAVFDRHAAIVEADDRGGLGAPAHLVFSFAEGEARRLVLHHDCGDALGSIFAGAAHDQIKVGEAGAGDERLRAVEQIVGIAIGPCAGAQRPGVRTRARFGQAV